jgi:phage FluMu protein gp41
VSNITGELAHGIKVGETVHRDYEMRALDGLEYIECLAQSEKAIREDGQPTELVASPALMTINVLKGRLVRVGTIVAPISDEIFRLLTPSDIWVMLQTTRELDAAMMEAVEHSGRLDPPGA